MQLNTPGVSDGEMAFWMNDVLAHRESGLRWRDVPELGLNRAGMSHFIDSGDADRPNRVSFDDFVVSTSRVGCDTSAAELDAGVPPRSDAGLAPADAGGGEGGLGDASPPRTMADGGRTIDAGERPTSTPSRLVGGCSAGAGRPTALSLSFGVLLALWARRRRRSRGAGSGRVGADVRQGGRRPAAR